MGVYKLTSAAQQEALLSLDKLSQDEFQGYFSFSQSDVKFILSHRGVENRLGIGLQLCLTRYPGISLNLVDKVSNSLIEYVAAQLKISTVDLDNYLSKKNTPLALISIPRTKKDEYFLKNFSLLLLLSKMGSKAGQANFKNSLLE